MSPSIGVATVASLTINPGATLDLGNNTLMIDYGTSLDPISNVRSDLTTGYANGTWTGTALTSSTAAANPGYALGYADGVDGIVSGLASGQIEIKYTLYGDLNLDGLVNATDFAILGANFGAAVSAWDQGDLTYDNLVNATDFAMLGSNFGQAANLGAVQLPSVVNSLTPANNSSVVTNTTDSDGQVLAVSRKAKPAHRHFA